MLDFMIAKMKHQMWKRKLSQYINENTAIDEQELVSERDCELGKWLYSQGLEKYNNMLEIHSLERIHKQLHELTYSIVLDKKNNHIDSAKNGLKQLTMVSDEVVGILDKLELKIKTAP